MSNSEWHGCIFPHLQCICLLSEELAFITPTVPSFTTGQRVRVRSPQILPLNHITSPHGGQIPLFSQPTGAIICSLTAETTP